MPSPHYPFGPVDALLIVDAEDESRPGSDNVSNEINQWIQAAIDNGIPIFAGGTTNDTALPGLRLPPNTTVIREPEDADTENYSAFDNTDLAERLRLANCERLWLAGAPLEHAVKRTAIDARMLGYEVRLIAEGTHAINAHPHDGARTMKELEDLGVFVEYFHGTDLIAA